MPIVAVFGSSRVAPEDPAYQDAMLLGSLLALEGFTVANGGYAGVMEAVSKGARSEGGAVVGVTAPSVFPGRGGGNGHLTSEVEAATLSERIHRLIDLSDASIALPGSLGTVAEFVVAWNEGFLAPLRGETAKPHVAVGPMWKGLIDHLVGDFGADASCVACVDTVEEAVERVREGLRAVEGRHAG